MGWSLPLTLRRHCLERKTLFAHDLPDAIRARAVQLASMRPEQGLSASEQASAPAQESASGYRAIRQRQSSVDLFFAPATNLALSLLCVSRGGVWRKGEP